MVTEMALLILYAVCLFYMYTLPETENMPSIFCALKAEGKNHNLNYAGFTFCWCKLVVLNLMSGYNFPNTYCYLNIQN